MAQHIFTCFWIQDFLWRIEIIDWFARQCQGVRYTSILSFVELFSLQVSSKQTTLWYQLEDMFQLIVTAQGIEKVTIKLIDTPTKVCQVVFIKGAPRSALKLGIDPINSHASYFGESTGSNKRSVLINRTVSSNWNQRVPPGLP